MGDPSFLQSSSCSLRRAGGTEQNVCPLDCGRNPEGRQAPHSLERYPCRSDSVDEDSSLPWVERLHQGPSRQHSIHLPHPSPNPSPPRLAPISEAPLLSQMGRTWEQLLIPRAGQPQAAPSLSGLLKLVQFFNRGPISFTNGGPRGARAHLFRACALAGPHCPASRPRVGPLSSPPAGAAYR